MQATAELAASAAAAFAAAAFIHVSACLQHQLPQVTRELHCTRPLLPICCRTMQCQLSKRQRTLARPVPCGLWQMHRLLLMRCVLQHALGLLRIKAVHHQLTHDQPQSINIGPITQLPQLLIHRIKVRMRACPAVMHHHYCAAVAPLNSSTTVSRCSPAASAAAAAVPAGC
jgi:hypothetical protein